MKIKDVIWLDQIVEKLQRKHSVWQDEVEETFANRPRVKHIENGDISGEDLYRALGQTDSGRYLAVFFIYKGENQALVISAREMNQKEKKSYGKSKS